MGQPGVGDLLPTGNGGPLPGRQAECLPGRPRKPRNPGPPNQSRPRSDGDLDLRASQDAGNPGFSIRALGSVYAASDRRRPVAGLLVAWDRRAGLLRRDGHHGERAQIGTAWRAWTYRRRDHDSWRPWERPAPFQPWRGCHSAEWRQGRRFELSCLRRDLVAVHDPDVRGRLALARSEEHTSELQSLRHLVCRLLL